MSIDPRERFRACTATAPTRDYRTSALTSLLAAQAHEAGATIVTTREKHFEALSVAATF